MTYAALDAYVSVLIFDAFQVTSLTLNCILPKNSTLKEMNGVEQDPLAAALEENLPL